MIPGYRRVRRRRTLPATPGRQAIGRPLARVGTVASSATAAWATNGLRAASGTSRVGSAEEGEGQAVPPAGVGCARRIVGPTTPNDAQPGERRI